MQQVVNVQQPIIKPRKFKVYQHRQLDKIEALKKVPADIRFEMKVVANVLPFRVNEYVFNELIDWENVPNDPLFQLTFPQKDMLEPSAYQRMADLMSGKHTTNEVFDLATQLRDEMNPHPAGQMQMNVPHVDGEPLPGMQHKYRETVLFFPAQGQYVTDLLVTGGDPMVMRTRKLAHYLEGLLKPEFEHIKTIRIGTKSLTFWPYRFITDPDADDMLRLLERLVAGGKHVSIMAHLNHPNELRTEVCQEAVRRLRATGAQIRCQAPLLKHINDDPDVWASMWDKQVQLGMIPYYMFVERDTGAKRYFEVPLERTWEVFQKAYQQVSGIARTVRGPSMSAGPGKVEIQGVTEIAGEKVFALRFIQGRNPDWVQRPFFAKYNPDATWLHQLEPAFGEEKFFFEDEYSKMSAMD
ncbi:MAG: lysine 2,3-aminomutase [Idiomarina sp.]|nr:lysine 2,3-aminomutase [Idiomarina sp.]